MAGEIVAVVGVDWASYDWHSANGGTGGSVEVVADRLRTDRSSGSSRGAQKGASADRHSHCSGKLGGLTRGVHACLCLGV